MKNSKFSFASKSALAVAIAAVAMSAGSATGPNSEIDPSQSAGTVEQHSPLGNLLMESVTAGQELLAYHGSHSSHGSHGSHQSHASHSSHSSGYYN